MTQSNETTATQAVLPQNVPFNLIVATSAQQVEKIAKHFDLSDVRLVDSLKLPAGGAKRGDALNELLSKTEHTITLAVVTDAPWVGALLNNSPMASSVWRSIESQLVGHRTGTQRNFMIIAGTFLGDCRTAENAGQLLAIVAGQPIPSNWKPERVKPEVAKKAEPKKTASKPHSEKKAQPQKNQGKPQVTVANGAGKSGKGPKPQLDRTQKHKGPRPVGSNASLHDDLYLLSKGHYGVPTGPHFVVKAQQLISHHTGFGGLITNHMVVVNLFRTLIAKSGRGYWGGFNVLQSVIEAGGQGTEELIEQLNGFIANIPAVDGQGNEIPQPKANPKLMEKFGVATKQPTQDQAHAA